MDGDVPRTRNRVWTTDTRNNGFFGENLQQQSLQRLETPGNLSTLSGQIAPARAFSGQSKHTSYENANPTVIGIQSRFRRRYYQKVILGALIACIVILLITIIVLSIRTYKKSNNMCRSKECIRTAASLIYSMDEETDPCKDFFQFTCGHWADQHPRPDSATSNDWFREQQTNMMRQVREFLKSNITSSQPEAVGMAKTVYKACMNTTLLDERELEPLIYYIRRFKLPVVPSIFNLTLSGSSAYANETLEFRWLETVALIKQYLGMDLIIGFDVFPDPLNRTINRIALGTPETDSALPFNNDDTHKLFQKLRRKEVLMQNTDEEDSDDHESEEEEASKQTNDGMIAYTNYIRKVIETYLLFVDADVNKEDATIGISELVKHGVNVARSLHKLKEEAENSTKPTKNPADDIVYLSLAEMQNLTDKNIAPKAMPIWTRYIDILLTDTKHSGKFGVMNISVITSQADILYLQNVVEYLQETPLVHIESYLWLTSMEELVLHTTSTMRLLHTDYMRKVIGTEATQARSLYCAHGVNSLFGMAVSYFLANDEFNTQKLPRVDKMLNNIRRSFDKLVQATPWMDANTKRKTMQKSAEMKSFIGFPNWLTNHTALNEYYKGVEVNVSRHLENLVGFLRWQMLEKLNYMDQPEPFGWATSPSNVNAFHTFQSNAITIPIAILQYPFYDLGLEALNYGAIGTILGHELTHGFDDNGRMFDKEGNMIQWWSNETITEYINRTDCFVSQYSRYHLSDIDEYIDGELTLGENIADNGGMREAFYAYRLYVEDIGGESLNLPGLEQYTHEQLFFIAFGNLWCETYTPAASHYALEDSHCPGKIRLKGVLSNSEEFAKSFKCARGTEMNPDEDKCRIW